MKIVFLDAKTIGDDIDLSAYDTLGEVVKYSFSRPEEVPERAADADVLIVNKIRIDEAAVGRAEHLKLVCVTATGTNNLDKDYLERRGIAWRNVADYSTQSVAQHTFAMLFFLLEKLRYYDDYVKEGRYINDTVFTHFAEHFYELKGKTWGIIGLGNIGRRVAARRSLWRRSDLYFPFRERTPGRVSPGRSGHSPGGIRHHFCSCTAESVYRKPDQQKYFKENEKNLHLSESGPGSHRKRTGSG